MSDHFFQFQFFLLSADHIKDEMNWIFFLFPFIVALIGWATNFLAVKMLFHPKESKKILGLPFTGISKRQKVLAEKLGQLVAEELFSMSDLSEKIKDFATSEEAMDEVGRIEMTIRDKLVKTFPMLAMFLSDEMVEKVTGLLKESSKTFGGDIHRVGGKLEQNINVQKMVQDRVNSFSSEKLEHLLNELMKKEFRFIEIVGGP